MEKEIERKPFYNSSIPNEWDVKFLDDLGEFKNGINKDIGEFGHGCPLVGLMDVFGIPKIYNTEFSLVNSTENERRDFDLRKGDVLFVRSSVKPEGVGLTTLVCEDIPKATFSGFLIRFRNNGKLDFEFKAHCFFESNFRQRLLNKSTISANTNINQVALKSLKIALPSLPEQKAIAHILSLMDTAISKNNSLITQKELQKKWLMQNLLTGKKRLKGFSGEWKKFHLDKIADVRDGTHESPEYHQQGIKFITSKNIKNGVLDFTNVSYISMENANDFNRRSKVDKGDILMSMIGTIGNSVLIDFEPDFCIKNVGLIKSKQINPNYLIQYLHSTFFQNYLLGKLDGGIQKFISLSGLRKLLIPVPPPEEQTAIAKVLQTSDKEIQLLKTKSEKLKDKKKWLMQVLLTGKKRLNLDLKD